MQLTVMFLHVLTSTNIAAPKFLKVNAFKSRLVCTQLVTVSSNQVNSIYEATQSITSHCTCMQKAANAPPALFFSSPSTAVDGCLLQRQNFLLLKLKVCVQSNNCWSALQQYRQLKQKPQQRELHQQSSFLHCFCTAKEASIFAHIFFLT